MMAVVLSCRRLLMHRICCALVFAEDSAGNNRAARGAMMAMTTRSSMRVNAGPPVNLLPGPTLLSGSNCWHSPFIESDACPFIRFAGHKIKNNRATCPVQSSSVSPESRAPLALEALLLPAAGLLDG